MIKLVFLVSALALVSARSTSTSQNAIPQDVTGRSDDNSFFGDLKFLHKMYSDCASTDLSTCLKLKLVNAMDRAARAYPVINLIEGVSFVQEEGSAPSQTENDVESNLPRALNDREDALNNLIVDRIFNFFQTHTLQVIEKPTD